MKRIGLLAVGFLLAGCGGGSSSGSGAQRATADPTAAVAWAVRAYSAAFLGNDPESAYALLSARCQGANPYDRYAALVRGAYLLWPDQPIKSLTVNDISATTAHVTYLYGNKKLDQHNQRWDYEADSWRWDAC